ncbi:MAG: transaldolase family protein [Phycisphaerae bacterium]
MAIASQSKLSAQIKDFILQDTQIDPGQTRSFPTNQTWQRLGKLGTQLWLDTGSLDESQKLWTREFAALTTNNSLLNKEVQRGTYDDVIPAAYELLSRHGLSQREILLEIAFILNARHALKLVRKYDAYVSVEEHTDLADDLEQAVATARRFHEICPERFIVKLPLTPAGILATRILAGEGIAINHTLGFSARQNYMVARIAEPAYVNVFLGRLNSFVADNDLGDGEYVGEKATLASQAAIQKLRRAAGIETRQIGASYRQGQQVADLAGIDVMTMPPKVASEFLELDIDPDQLTDKTETIYEPRLSDRADEAGIETLWLIDENVRNACDALEAEDLDLLTAADLVKHFQQHGAGNLLIDWSDQQIETSAAEGKIPKLENWKGPLSDGSIGLDALMNLAGLNAFRADQKAMDDKVLETLDKSGRYKPDA